MSPGTGGHGAFGAATQGASAEAADAPCANTCMWKTSAEKSGAPITAEMNGVITFEVSDEVIWPNAAPMSTATARSTTLPRRMKSRKPLSMAKSPAGLFVPGIGRVYRSPDTFLPPRLSRILVECGLTVSGAKYHAGENSAVRAIERERANHRRVARAARTRDRLWPSRRAASRGCAARNAPAGLSRRRQPGVRPAHPHPPRRRRSCHPPTGQRRPPMKVALQREPIDTAALHAEIKAGTDGAVCIFDGIVRDNTRGRRTL